MLRREPRAIDHVKDSDAQIFINLDVHRGDFVKPSLQLVFAFLFKVSHDPLLVKSAEILESEAADMLRHAHEFLAVLEHQLLVPVRDRVVQGLRRGRIVAICCSFFAGSLRFLGSEVR